MKFIFYSNAIYITIKEKRKQFFYNVEAKYSTFVDLNKLEKGIFLYNIDPYVCKKLGYNDYEAFQLRETYPMKQKHGK